MRIIALLLCLLALACATPAPSPETKPAQAVKAEPQPDPFLWLEEVEGEKALSWVEAQNKESLKVLEQDPRYGQYLSEAETILNAQDRIPYVTLRGNHVYNFWQDKTHVRGLWRRTSLASYRLKKPRWETVLSLDELAKNEAKNWVYKGVTCLPPAYVNCMLRLSIGGKDASVNREFNLKTKAFVKDGFVVPEAKSSVQWIDADTLLIGTDWGEDSLTTAGYPRIVKKWRRATPLSKAETVLSGKKDDTGVWPWVIHRPGQTLPIVIRSKTFFTSQYYLVSDKGEHTKVPIQESAEIKGYYKGHFIISLREAWSVQKNNFPQAALLAFSSKSLLETQGLPPLQTLMIPDQRTSIGGVYESGSGLFITTLQNVKGRISHFSMDQKTGTWSAKEVNLPPTGTLAITSATPFHKEILINYEDHITPDRLYEYHAARQKSTILKTLPTRFDAKGLVVHQYQAKAKDGEDIPYFVIHAKNLKYNSKNPAILYGYGGFEISLKPRYSAISGKLWLERGGVYVISNIRGGGEFGPRWHKAALKEKRQTSFDDFAAVAEDLIARKITSPQYLGIMGGSNGGLLMGAAFTQRPELFKAVVCQVPLLDMLRYTKLLAGASWIDEYGDPEDPEMRKVLAGYSPYHNVSATRDYPDVFFLTSTKDDRVHPGHARKMVAKMKQLGHQVYCYENTEGGHSAGANLKQHAKRYALEFTYFAQQLGLP